MDIDAMQPASLSPETHSGSFLHDFAIPSWRGAIRATQAAVDVPGPRDRVTRLGVRLRRHHSAEPRLRARQTGLQRCRTEGGGCQRRRTGAGARRLLLTAEAAEIAAQAITDADSGRVLVDITLTGRIAVDTVKANLVNRFPQLTITAVDASYRGTGILEGFASLDDVHRPVARQGRARGVPRPQAGYRFGADSIDRPTAIAGPVSTSCERRHRRRPMPTRAPCSTRSARRSTRAWCSIVSIASASCTTPMRRSATTVPASPSRRCPTATTPAPPRHTQRPAWPRR